MKVLAKYVFLAAIFASSVSGNLKEWQTKSFPPPHFTRGGERRDARLRHPSLSGLDVIFSGRPPPFEGRADDSPVSALPSRHAVFQNTFTSTPTGNFVHGFLPNIFPGRDPIAYFAGSVLPHASEGGLPNVYTDGNYHPIAYTDQDGLIRRAEGDVPSFRTKDLTPVFYSSEISSPTVYGNGEVFPFGHSRDNSGINRVGRLYPVHFQAINKPPNTNKYRNFITNVIENEIEAPKSSPERHLLEFINSYLLQENLPGGFSVNNARSRHQTHQTFRPDDSPIERNPLNSSPRIWFPSHNPSPAQKMIPSSHSTVNFTPKILMHPQDVGIDEDNSQSVRPASQHSENRIPVPHYPKKMEPKIDLSLKNSFPEHVRNVLEYLQNFTPTAYYEANTISDSLHQRDISATANSRGRVAHNTDA